MNEPLNKKAVGMYVLGGLMFSLAGILFKPLVGVLGPLEIAGWRSVVVVLTLLLLRGRSPRRLPLSFSNWQWFSALGLALQTICFSIAILTTSTADTFLITNATPVYMVVWQTFFDRRLPTRPELLIVLIAVSGLAMFFYEALASTTLLGLLAGLAAGFAFAAHIYGQGRVGREGKKDGEPLTLGSVLLGGLIAASVTLPLDAAIGEQQFVFAPLWAHLSVVALGVFQFAIPMMLWARALPHIPPLFAAFMPTLIAIWAPCLTYLLLSEPFPGAVSLIGAVIVHAAVIAAAGRNLKTGNRTISPPSRPV